MKKILSILLATLMIAGLVLALPVGAATEKVNKATAITREKNGRTYHFYESFDTDTVVQGAAKVINTLGWELPDDTDKANAHEANVQATEKGQNATYMYELKNGRLYLRNRGSQNEYMMICDAGELALAFDGAYVIEYTLTYLASSTSTDDGYMSLIYNTNTEFTQYAESVLRISGWGNSRATVGRDTFGALDADDVSTLLAKEKSLTAYRVDNDRNPTLYERVCGDIDVVPGTSNVVDMHGSKVMIDVEMRVRMEFDGTYGPRIYVNDVVVSDPRSMTDATKAAAAQSVYQDMLLTGGSALGFCVTPGIDCVLDEITVYETYATVDSALYITEVAPLPDNALAPYYEIHNGGDADVNLADYVTGYVVRNANGSESVSALPMANFIGGTLNVGTDTVLENLSAEAAILAPGETVVIFPVDASAAVDDLAATVDGVTMAGFRAEYGLSADAKVLALAADGFEVKATEHRFWFVGDYMGANGRPVTWLGRNSNAMKNSDDVQCIVELVPSVAFGVDSDIYDETKNENGAMNIGRGGELLAGYAAHYIYGANAAASVKTGLLVSRTAVKIADEQNTGKVLDVQADYFERIKAYRAGHYLTEGALAITEIIPVTAEDDAYEAFEITNISENAINLYDYALVSSGDAVYGSLTDWTCGSVFETTANGIKNPNAGGACMIAPAGVVVVWNMTDASEGKTVDDFRSYYGLKKTVTVVALDSTAANSVVAANEGTVSYGVASADAVRAMLAGSAAEVVAVSDVTVPVHSLCYNVNGLHTYTWDELMAAGRRDVIAAMIDQGMDGCEMLGVQLQPGASLDGYFTRELVEGAYHYIPCDAEDTAESDVEYFEPKDVSKFIAYGSVQDLSLPVDGAIAVSYGASCYANKTSGSLMMAMQVNSYLYDDTGRGFGAVPYLLTVANRFVTVDAVSGLSAATLGDVMDKQGVSISVHFPTSYYTVTYLDGNGEVSATVTLNKNTCGDVYTVLTDEYSTWQVNGVVYDAGTTVDISGDTLIAPGFLTLASGTGDLFADNDADDTATPDDTTLAMGMDNAADAADAKGGLVLILLAAVLGCALIATVCVIVAKKRKAE